MVIHKINVLSQDLVRWVNLHGLALNQERTTYMVFARQRIDFSGTELSIDNRKIEKKQNAGS